MPKIILLVDDTETVLMFEKMMLASSGYQLVTAKNGQQALELISKNQPDLVLLDVMMPIMNGIETCQAIKANPETAHIPVLMVTTKGEPEMVEKAFVAGCNDYLTKPVDKMELLSKVKTYLN